MDSIAPDKIEPESPLVDEWHGRTPAAIHDKSIDISERPEQEKLVLVTDGSEGATRAATAVLGTPLPQGPEDATGDNPCCIWRAPGHWLITHDRGNALPTGLSAAAVQGAGTALDVSDGWVCVEISGPAARSMLSRGCDADLHARAFPPGRFKETQIAGIDVIIYARSGSQGYAILVERALAVDLWLWLKEHASDLVD